MKNLRVRTQLTIAFLVMVVLVAAVSLTSASNMRNLNREVTFLVDERIEKLLLLDRWNIAVLNTARHMRSALIVESPEAIRQELDGVRESRKLRDETLARLDASIRDTKGRELLASIKEIHVKLIYPEEEFLKAVNAGDTRTAKILLLNQARPLQMQYIEGLKKFIDFEVQLPKETAQHATANFTRDMWVISSLGALALLASIFLAFVISRNIRDSSEENYPAR